MPLSGPEWCKEFPTSTSLDDLAQPFQNSCKAFIAALESAGAKVTIAATYRPPERAALMHYCCMVAYSKMDPALVPTIGGVDIQWDWGNAASSIQAAKAMAQTYGIEYPAALVSRHTQRLAVDIKIDLGGTALQLPHTVIYENQPATLYAAGASYGVVKLLSDPPHWSSDGH